METPIRKLVQSLEFRGPLLQPLSGPFPFFFPHRMTRFTLARAPAPTKSCSEHWTKNMLLDRSEDLSAFCALSAVEPRPIMVPNFVFLRKEIYSQRGNRFSLTVPVTKVQLVSHPVFGGTKIVQSNN